MRANLRFTGLRIRLWAISHVIYEAWCYFLAFLRLLLLGWLFWACWGLRASRSAKFTVTWACQSGSHHAHSYLHLRLLFLLGRDRCVRFWNWLFFCLFRQLLDHNLGCLFLNFGLFGGLFLDLVLGGWAWISLHLRSFLLLHLTLKSKLSLNFMLTSLILLNVIIYGRLIRIFLLLEQLILDWLILHHVWKAKLLLHYILEGQSRHLNFFDPLHPKCLPFVEGRL